MKKIIFSLALPIVFFITPIVFFNEDHPQIPEINPAYFAIDTIAKDMAVPWDIVFLPDSSMLFTERPGRVRLVSKNELQEAPVLTIPDVEVKGKMGLLALCLSPNFSNNHFVYLAYNYRLGNTTFLRIARYSFLNGSLIDPQTIIESIPGVFNHTGCRLRFGPDKKLYITTGDADVPRLAQDLKLLNGKILRLNENGTIPADNPFAKSDTARKEIWTYGHRNSQGIAFQPGTGFLYNSEHGPTGGDEINIVTRGNNYGWPVTHHRNNMDGMMAPLMEFTPSIGPAEAIFYSGKAFPSMKGNLLVACMRGEAILKVEFDKGKISAYNFLLKNNYGRIRALAEGPDGNIYFSTSHVDPPESNAPQGAGDYDMVLRMRPATLAEIEDKKAFSLTADKLHQAINDNHAGTNRATTTTKVLYAQLCAGCHGADLKGADTKPGLLKTLHYGNSFAALKKSIIDGVTDKGMPAWKGVLTDKQTNDLVNYILVKRK